MSEKSITCLGGAFMPAHEAAVPVADRGFRFGDGVFETIRLHHGVPYQWGAHMARLSEGLAALRIAPPAVDFAHFARQTIHKNAASDGFLRIAVSRGVGSHGYLPDADISATWVIEYLSTHNLTKRSFDLWKSSHERISINALPANKKLANGIGSTLALLEARDHGCDEALMISHAGHIAEAASGNLFWVTDGALYTPALTTGCLDGTTRAAVMRLLPIPCTEILADMAKLHAAQAMFITNVRLGVWPVATLKPTGKTFDTAHPLLTEIAARLDADRELYSHEHAAKWATP